MGRDKARLKLGGLTLLRIIRRTAQELGLTVRTIRRDRVRRCGPLGGIYTGLITSRTAAELFLACDMPFVDAALLEKLIGHYMGKRRAVFTRCKEVAGFPLLLPHEAAQAVKKQIDKRSYSLQKLAAGLNAQFLDIGTADWGKVMNVNTPEEWERAREMWVLNRAQERIKTDERAQK
jgi:molybdopterin-guanine dinucleotide biosynthesis protein A